MVAEWSRAPANSSREEGGVGSSPSPAKITFSDEIFFNNSRVHSGEHLKYLKKQHLNIDILD